MAKLPKHTLSYNEQKQQWDLKNDATKRVIESFDTKQQAITGGALADALGKAGGSVKIQKTDGKFQEERTYPRSADPSKSPG